jgi:hypothetical protein
MRRPLIRIRDDDPDFAKLVAANLGRRGSSRSGSSRDPELALSEYDNRAIYRFLRTLPP